MDQLIGGAPGAGAPGANAADLIKDSNQQTFAQDVIDVSMQVPVIVDFWAPWCGPCKQLGPLIEKVVKEAKGAVRLVKINVDESQALAAQLRIQSIPAVYAFFQGRPVDGFVGAQPESQLKQFVQRLAKMGAAGAGPSPVDEALEQAEAAFAEGDFGAASAIFGQVLDHESDNAKAIAGLVRCSIATGDLAGAKEMLEGVTPELLKNPAIGSAVSQLELAEAGQKAAGQTQQLQARIDANPKDFEARHDLAIAQFAAGEREAAIDQLLEIFKANRAWNEDAARKQLVKFFEAMGPTDPLTLAGRRKLSSLMFS
ncbi:thioredoxin [Dongia sedimenti]|uniref:Thioredoxin n=1 Tax=Dongia sedimenti TaxID=3064282 RepID=A0ABU0YPX4_9PROT|nr:thioredoxin [Rhodospirillaceae bacterium R-7]